MDIKFRITKYLAVSALAMLLLGVAKVQITGNPCNSPTVKMEVKQPEGEAPIRWVKLQLASGATLFLKNTTVLDLSLLLNKMIG